MSKKGKSQSIDESAGNRQHQIRAWQIGVEGSGDKVIDEILLVYGFEKKFNEAKECNDLEAIKACEEYKKTVESFRQEMSKNEKSINRAINSFDEYKAHKLKDEASEILRNLANFANKNTLSEIEINKYLKNDATFENLPISGQENAKRSLDEIISTAKINREKKKRGLRTTSLNFHSIFSGPPGTGKTTFARYFASEVKKLGILKTGHFIECSRSDLVASYMGQTAEKITKMVKNALGGVLFIDEAYSLVQGDSDAYGQEAVDTLLKLIEDHRDEFILILAGYEEEMRGFMDTNPGLKSRIPNLIKFEDYDAAKLKNILISMTNKEGYELSNDDANFAIDQVLLEKKGAHFGNARTVRNILERAIRQQNFRISQQDLTNVSDEEMKSLIFSDFTKDPNDEGSKEDVEKNNNSNLTNTDTKTEESATKKLNDLIGLESVKESISELKDYIAIEKMRNRGDSNLNIGLHMAFLGKPGTGKTTVARILGEILKEIEILPSGHIVECDRSDLVAEYIGQTAVKTQKKIQEAIGGILFVDEAYTLAKSNFTNGSDFGQEAIDTLLKEMEDNRGQLVCIFAGYEKEMESFFNSNPGLKSRIPNILSFEDYSKEDLKSILGFYLKERGLIGSDKYMNSIVEIADRKRRSRNFANARTIRNLFEASLKNQAKRLMLQSKIKELSTEELNCLTEDDVEAPRGISTQDKAKQLRELKELLDIGEITEEQFKNRKDEILG